MKVHKIFWLALYFLIPSILIGLIFSSPTAFLDEPLYRLSVVAGALAFVWLVNQLIISARPKFIERYFGLDRMYRFHAWMAVVCLGLLVVHRQSKLAWAGFAPNTAQIAAILFILVVTFALIFLADTRLRSFKFVRDMVAFADKKLGLTFNRVVLFHNLTVVASVLMALHVLGTSTAQDYLPVRIFYFVYFALGAAFYLYHKFFRPWRQGRRAYQIAAVVDELPNLRTLQLMPPANDAVFNYQPGQFAFITPLRGPVAREEHPFTISSSPVNREAITFTIKALGDFTASLKHITPGIPVRVDAPYGIFSYRHVAVDRPLGFIAGGIGITPMLSMLRTLREEEPIRQVTFLWGVNQPEELFCLDELKAMQVEMPHFTWRPVVALDETWPGEKGFIDREKIERLMLNNNPNQDEIEFFVCGPKVMMKLVIGHLKDAGVPGKRIRSERFSL